jgi:Uma2 family endonuclease
LIDEFVEQNQLGEVRYEGFAMRLASVPSAREPDLLFVRSENIDRIQETFLDGPADLAIEVISLESRERDRGAKFYEYEQGGVLEYWLIDPIRKQFEFYRLDETGRYQLIPTSSDGYFYSGAITGFRLNPSWLWQDPLPRPLSVLELASQAQAS